MRKLVVSLAGLAMLVGCAPGPGGPADGAHLTGQWIVTSINGAPTLENARPTLELADGQASGSASCNRWSAAATQDGAALTIGLAAMTEMACEEAVMSQEAAFAAALARVTQVRASGANRELLDADGQVVLVLEPAPVVPDLPLEGTTWQLQTLVDADAASSTISGTTVTMTISGGVLSGRACNTFTGPVTFSGDDGLTIGPLATTRMACGEDEMRQEDTVLATLEAATTFAITGSVLSIKAPDGTALDFRGQ
jgi:heat shock protein HslJ